MNFFSSIFMLAKTESTPSSLPSIRANKKIVTPLYLTRILTILCCATFTMFMFLNKHASVIIELNSLKISRFEINFVILSDKISIAFFFFTVLLVRSIVYYYAKEYTETNTSSLFVTLIKLFVSSIIMLIFIPMLFSIIVGWDGLGVTSYLLVHFYKNRKSSNARTVTILSNRVGDFFMISLAGITWTNRSLNFFILTRNQSP